MKLVIAVAFIAGFFWCAWSLLKPEPPLSKEDQEARERVRKIMEDRDRRPKPSEED